MRTIIPDRLWIAPSADVNSLREFLNADGGAIVQLAHEEPPVSAPRDLIIGRFPLNDGAGNNETVVRAALIVLRFLIENAVPTLVTCGAGMSRSPCIVAAALALTNHRELNDCLSEVTAAGPVDISPALLAEVREIIR